MPLEATKTLPFKLEYALIISFLSQSNVNIYHLIETNVKYFDKIFNEFKELINTFGDKHSY